MTTDSLVAVVAKERTGDVIDALEAEGVYDDTRRVTPWGDGTVAVPVTSPPTRTAVAAVVADDNPAFRQTGLDVLLRDRGFTDDELAAVPKSWAVIGTVILARFADCPRPKTVGEALLELHGNADTVLDDRGVSGPRREPDVAVVAGAGDTETVHVEHDTMYALDLADVMFSPGNQAERVRMGDVVAPDERVLDMFAGIGYFTLPMARAGANVTAVEVNPASFRYLAENVVLNDVADRVHPYLGDCRDVDASADRVVMGHFDAHEYLGAALDALEPGGTLHLHAATPTDRFPDRPVGLLEAAVDATSRGVTVEDTRVVKGYSAGIDHVVVDATVE